MNEKDSNLISISKKIKKRDIYVDSDNMDSLIDDIVMNFEIIGKSLNDVESILNKSIYKKIFEGNDIEKVLNLCKDFSFLVDRNLKVGSNLETKYNFSVKDENLLQNRTVIIPIEKAKGQINIDCHEGIYQLYKNNILISTFTNSSSISTELGNYYLIDFKNNKKYDDELKYKDQYTPIIYAYLHIKDEYVNNNKKSIKNSIVNVGTNDDITHNKPNYQKIKELPNTVNYIKIIKTFLAILLCLIGIKYVKTKKK